jgi:hypothetical protein
VLTLTDDEVQELTGGLSQPAAQLRRLRELGYYRAWRSKVTGRVVLERAHAEAVQAGRATMQPPAPKLRPPTLRQA